MYFKKLEIFGFKSFAERTVFNFEPGITAVVGPNGCGKSNVFDSIRWVLGEQSAKQMRGSGMEDVIFNGTDTKLALGFAEVSVTFDNSSRTLPILTDEVVITRRLFRSGESEYLINKEVRRLKDIVELVMGTGIGAEAYSLVQQGRVDLVVSAKPDDRRMIFDEASGITKYKAKKREAQGKLKDTDQNLLRINDIVVEVKRQIGTIERQAKKAQRYKVEFEKLKDLEVIMAAWQLIASEKELVEVQQQIADIRGREGRFSNELEALRETLDRESIAIEELETGIQEAREQCLRTDNQVELQARQVAFNEERLENLSDNEKRIVGQKATLLEKCRSHQEKVDTLEKDLAALLCSAESSLQEFNDKRTRLSGLTSFISEQKASFREDEERLLQLNSREVDVRNKQTENMKEVQGVLARRRRLEQEQAKVVAERGAVDQKLQGISQGILEIMARRQALLDELSQKKSTLALSHEELAQLGAKLDGLERKKVFLISQKEFIEKLQVQYQDMPDPMITSRFFSPVPPSEKHSGVIGKVKGFSQIDPEKREELKQYLQDLEGDGLYEIMCETKFIELDPQEMASKIEQIEEEVMAISAQREAKGREVAEQSKVIERLQLDIHTEDKRYSVCEAQQNDVSIEAKKLWEEAESVRFEMEEADRILARAKEVEDVLSAEAQTVAEELAFVQDGIKEREVVVQAKVVEREALAVTVAQMEAEVVGLRDKEQSWRANIEMFRSDMNGFLEDIGRLEQESGSFKDRREGFLSEIETLRASIALLHEERAALQEQLSRQEAERQDVEQRLSSVRAQINGIEKESADDRDQVHGREMRLQNISFQIRSINERILQKYNIAMSPQMLPEEPAESLSLLKAETVEGQQTTVEEASVLGEGQDENAQECAVASSALVIEPASVEVPEGFDAESAAKEIQELSKRCNSFGVVNLVAINEFDELKDRFQFLTKQQADLLEAKTSLEQAIRKINKTTRQMFIDTFTKVNEQFRLYFRMLFNGGEAQLILVDPENALESGIEIVARPPGKKLQTISLLSGGEKTMTAIALIFSVFKVNPSPFCVLDEIDAALDEANVDRFATVLKEFAKIAQFIVITHNKKTIAHADVMYGVTMQQTGVSRVVSVKLSDKTKQERPNEVDQEAADNNPDGDQVEREGSEEESFATV